MTDVAWNNSIGRVLTPLNEPSRYAASWHPGTSRRPYVLQLTRYDPGSAACRYHSAFNVAPGGTSAFVRYGDENPHCSLRQYDGDRDREGVRELAESADVVHVHMDYSTIAEPALLGRWPDREYQLLVRHYHGSQPANEGTNPVLVENALDRNSDAVQIGARLYHQRFSDRMYWLPIPMPVLDYERLRARYWTPIEQRPGKRVRIAHSPTHARIKGTIVLETAVSDLLLKQLPVELVMIKDKSLGEALALKASCDITFDSFWLGIQGSGLEAACMGQAVVAGDNEVRAEYERAIGSCPYSFVSDFVTLREMLEQLVVDAQFREAEAGKVGAYVRKYHDYPVVGARYWQIINAERAARGFANAA